MPKDVVVASGERMRRALPVSEDGRFPTARSMSVSDSDESDEESAFCGFMLDGLLGVLSVPTALPLSPGAEIGPDVGSGWRLERAASSIRLRVSGRGRGA